MDKISSRKVKRPIKEVLPVANELKKKLQKLGLSGIVIAGSIRRKCSIVGDIDMMAKGNITLIEDSSDFEYIKGGEKSITFMFKNHQVNLYAYEDSFYGSMLMFLTGPGGYNIGVRCIAKKKGWKLSQYGLIDHGKVISKTEKEIYDALGKHYKEPELRGK